MAYTQQQRRAHIRELQTYLYAISLMDSSIPTVPPDGVFGKATAEAVSAFQQEYGLPVTGNADPATWNKLVSVYRAYLHAQPLPYRAFPSASYVVRRGDRGQLVYILQAMLSDLAHRYDNLPDTAVCGEYDDATAEAVRRFRSMTGLPAGNEVDSAAWNMLVHCCMSNNFNA